MHDPSWLVQEAMKRIPNDNKADGMGAGYITACEFSALDVPLERKIKSVKNRIIRDLKRSDGTKLTMLRSIDKPCGKSSGNPMGTILRILREEDDNDLVAWLKDFLEDRRFTDDERHILSHLASGAKRKAIAQAMGITTARLSQKIQGLKDLIISMAAELRTKVYVEN